MNPILHALYGKPHHFGEGRIVSFKDIRDELRFDENGMIQRNSLGEPLFDGEKFDKNAKICINNKESVANRSKVYSDIINYLKHRKSAQIKKIWIDLQVPFSRNQMDYMVNKLYKHGQLERIGHGEYRLKGKDHAA